MNGNEKTSTLNKETKTMTDCQAEMVKLWNAIASRYEGAIKAHKGKVYRFAQILTSEDDMVRVDFNAARKQRGAFVHDKVSISCIYKYRTDSYSILVEDFDGKTFDTVSGPLLSDMTVDLVVDNAEAVIRSLEDR